MKKAIVFLAILAVFLAGCGTNNVTEKKDAPQDSKSQSEITEKQETTTDLNKNLVPISTKTFDGIWKLTTYQDPESVKKITEWKPKPLDYKGGLQKKWSISVGYYDVEQSKVEQNNFLSNLPNGWALYSDEIKIQDYSIKWLINTENGHYNTIDKIKGFSDGNNLYSEDCLLFYKARCLNLENMKELWSTEYIDSYHLCGSLSIVGSNLILIDDRTKGKANIQRLDPLTGKVIWKLKFSSILDFISDYNICSYAISSKNIFVVVSHFNKSDENFYDRIMKYDYFKIDPLNGAVLDITFKPDFTFSKIACANEYIIISNNINKFYFYDLTSNESSYLEINEISTFEPIEFSSLKIEHITDNFYLIKSRKYDLQSSMSEARYIYDAIKKQYKRLPKNIATSVINSSLIFEYGNKSECINPENQETLWLIKYDKGNGYVKTMDSRGILTFQDYKLVCYAPK